MDSQEAPKMPEMPKISPISWTAVCYQSNRAGTALVIWQCLAILLPANLPLFLNEIFEAGAMLGNMWFLFLTALKVGFGVKDAVMDLVNEQAIYKDSIKQDVIFPQCTAALSTLTHGLVFRNIAIRAATKFSPAARATFLSQLIHNPYLKMRVLALTGIELAFFASSFALASFTFTLFMLLERPMPTARFLVRATKTSAVATYRSCVFTWPYFTFIARRVYPEFDNRLLNLKISTYEFIDKLQVSAVQAFEQTMKEVREQERRAQEAEQQKRDEEDAKEEAYQRRQHERFTSSAY